MEGGKDGERERERERERASERERERASESESEGGRVVCMHTSESDWLYIHLCSNAKMNFGWRGDIKEKLSFYNIDSQEAGIFEQPELFPQILLSYTVRYC